MKIDKNNILIFIIMHVSLRHHKLNVFTNELLTSVLNSSVLSQSHFNTQHQNSPSCSSQTLNFIFQSAFLFTFYIQFFTLLTLRRVDSIFQNISPFVYSFPTPLPSPYPKTPLFPVQTTAIIPNYTNLLLLTITPSSGQRALLGA